MNRDRLISHPPTTANHSSHRDRLQTLFLKLIKTEVESRLNQSLHQRIYLAQTAPDFHQLGSPGKVQLKIRENLAETLPEHTKIEEIFARPEIRDRLLIRGVPGSGKTTLLLQLAQVLCARAVNHPELPIPILLDIPSWARKKQAISKWIVTILKQKYSLDSATATQWIKYHQVILLLDGLDELEESQQDKFIAQLNKFLANHWSGSFVVCGGMPSDNHNQITQIPVNIDAVIELLPLTPEQISTYLVNTGCESLWNDIKNDADLINLVQIPLFLNLIIIAATEIKIPQWQQMPTWDDQQSYLWNSYIRHGLKRGDRKANLDNQGLTQSPFLTALAWGRFSNQVKHISENQQTWQWLSWLAHNSIKQKQPFSGFDYACLDKFLEKLASLFIIGLIDGLMSGVIFWLMFDRTFGFMFGAILGLIIGTIAGIFVDSLTPPTPAFSLTKQTWIVTGLGTLLSALVCGLISGSIFWPILGQDSGLIYGSLFAANGAFIFALFTLFTAGFSTSESRISYQLEKSDRPQRELLKNLVPYLMITLPMGAFWLWVVWVLQGKVYQFWQLVIGGLIIGGLLAIAFGGFAAIHQFSIRLILWVNRRISLNYRGFIHYAKSCLFIQTISAVTGGDRFIHPLLRLHLEKYDLRSHNPLPYYKTPK